MKKYILLAAIFIGTSAVSFSQTKVESKKRAKKEVKEEVKVVEKVEEAAPIAPLNDPNNPITFHSTSIDRKDIPFDKDNFFSFKFTNTGVEPITITGVRTSCGCTKAVQPESAVAPGETAEIAVTYDTKRVGSFTKTITVTTDKTEPITLTISGNVLENENATEGQKVESH